jgi:hypothetical protein
MIAGVDAVNNIGNEPPLLSTFDQGQCSKTPFDCNYCCCCCSCCLKWLAPTGVLPFSGGDALIYGNSIKSEAGLDSVRPLMGVCPQFDVLWGELSGQEHLTIAGHIKGLPWNKVCVQCGSWHVGIYTLRGYNPRRRGGGGECTSEV